MMEVPVGDSVHCTCCPFTTSFENLEVPTITIRSGPKQKPDWVAEAQEGGKNTSTGPKDMVAHAKIDEPCPKCGNPEMFFYTMQLRSVDEGSTVFYECTDAKCGNKFSQNN